MIASKRLKGDMKMKFAVIAVLVLAIIGVCIISIPHLIGQTNSDAGALFTVTGSGIYILDAAYPTVPDYIPIYRIKQVDISYEKAAQLALSMGMKGDIQYSGRPGVIQITDDSKNPPESIDIYTTSGAFRYSIPSKEGRSVTYQPLLPSYDEAKKIADTYLEERNLLRNDFTFEKVKVGDSQETWRAGDTKPLTHYDINLYVIYRRTINGIPATEGITVTIGENGEVVGLTYKATAIEEKAFRNVKIITPEEAYNQLVEGNVLIKPLPGVDSTIRITNVSLQYYMKAEVYEQQFVLPIYVFSGVEPSYDSSPIVLYVSAIDPDELKIPPLDSSAYSK
jgi:hypothetical protein